jgi:RNA polymerase sigma-70 factor (ECF subfamily)
MMQPDDVEDCDLIARALAGQRDAFAALVHRYQRPVFSIAYRLTGDRAVAQDLAQEAFLRAYQSLSTFDLGRPFSPWLFRIATNLSLNWLKRKRLPTVPLDQVVPGQGVPVPDDSPGPETLVLQAEFQARLWREVTALPPEFRAVIELRHGQQLSYQEIADRLNIPLSSVKSRLFRARQQMRKRLEGENDICSPM